MSRPSARVVLVALVLALALSGCAQQEPEPPPASTAPFPSTPPTPTPSAPPTPTPSPTPSDAIPSIPSCEHLLSVEQVRATVNEARIEGPDQGEPRTAESLPGPLARETYRGASDSITCGFGIPQSDGIVSVTVTVIDPVSGEELAEALAASAEYVHTTRDAIDLFSAYISDGIGTYLGYAFSGPVWVIVQGTLVNETTAVNLAADAATAVRDAQG